MEQSEQDAAQTRLPELAALQEPPDAAVSERPGVPVFTTKNVSMV
jgi:hypothetical protein